MRNRGDAAFSKRGAAVEARHLGRGTRLVDEGEACRIEFRLRVAPPNADRRHVCALLLAGVRRFFSEGQSVPVEAAPDRADDVRLAMCLFEMRRNLFQRDGGRRDDERLDLIRMRLVAIRAPIATLPGRRDRSRAPQMLYELRHGRGDDTEPPAYRTSGRSVPDRGHQAFAKVFQERLCHDGWPPPPAHSKAALISVNAAAVL